MESGHSSNDGNPLLSEQTAVPAEKRVGGEALRVLIIEDEAFVAELLAEILTEMGFSVCGIEATEAGAVAAAAKTKPDLMIVDARLREGTGIAAVTTIIQDQFIPHIFVSGDRLTDYTFHPRAVVLQKPFLEAELAKAIRRALETGAG